jgi:hypothetical protein
MPDENKQNEKGFFAKLFELFRDCKGSGCSCDCLKTAREKQAQEMAQKYQQRKSDDQEHPA